jgi:TRAP-type C4-dicarboxylate transport system permease small subunit
MMLLTVFDVVGRRFGMPVRGAYDLVRVCGAIAIGCALPLTKAVKGHIAIEFFFQRLGRRSRAVCDTLMRLLVLGLCGLLAHQFLLYGMQFRARGETTPTLHMPVFWVQWILAAACALMVLVTLWHLLHPGRPMLRSRT